MKGNKGLRTAPPDQIAAIRASKQEQHQIRKHRIGKAKHRQRTKPPEKGKLTGDSERRKIGDPPSATLTDSIGVLKFLGSVY
jgi:hypothetical protein